MTVVVDLAAAPSTVTTDENVPAPPDERGSLPVLGLATLGTSAAFALWTSLTCFVC